MRSRRLGRFVVLIGLSLYGNATYSHATKRQEHNLFYAISKRQDAMVERMVTEQPALLEARNECGNTPLIEAAWYGYACITALLIEHGANIEATNNQGQTALHVAVERAHKPVIRTLLCRGANTTAVSNDGKTPLIYASLLRTNKPATDILCMLTSSGVPVPYTAQDNCGNTALHYTILRGNYYGSQIVAQAMHQHAISLDQQNNVGQTALMLGAKLAYNKQVIMLVHEGASTLPADNKGKTALWYAVNYGNNYITSFLLDHGAAVNTVTKNGWSYLMLSAWYGREDATTLLRRYGATTNLKNNKGQTAYDIACERRYTDLLCMLSA